MTLFPAIPTDPSTFAASLTIDVHAWLDANSRKHWSHRARETAVFVRQAAVLAKRAGLPNLGLRYVDVVFRPAGKSARRHDPGNLFPTCKAAQDGIVRAGVLPDDSTRYVRSLTLLAAVPGERELLTIELYRAPEV